MLELASVRKPGSKIHGPCPISLCVCIFKSSSLFHTKVCMDKIISCLDLLQNTQQAGGMDGTRLVLCGYLLDLADGNIGIHKTVLYF